jgi:hypothetical protein
MKPKANSPEPAASNLINARYESSAPSPALRADEAFQSKDGEIQLTLPDGWQQTTPKNPAIIIDAENVANHEHANVLAEASADFSESLQEYAKGRAESMGRNLDNSVVSQPTSVKAAGKDAIQYEIHGTTKTAGHIKLGYLMTVVQGSSHFIQVIGWSTQSHFADGRSDFVALADGISELKK